MILVAVIIGYLLGAMPFIVPKLIENREKQVEVNENEKDYKSQEEILDEWLNGPRLSINGVNQEDIYKEYMTGQETKKGD